jgi:hypothetical protein
VVTPAVLLTNEDEPAGLAFGKLERCEFENSARDREVNLMVGWIQSMLALRLLGIE